MGLAFSSLYPTVSQYALFSEAVQGSFATVTP